MEVAQYQETHRQDASEEQEMEVRINQSINVLS